MGSGPDVLRVSVVGGHDRVDLVVPAAVRVAELLPELARRVGRRHPLADADELWLSVLGGARLDDGSGLADQGVTDGAVLTVTAPSDHVAAADDDLAVVVAEEVESVRQPPPGLARWAALATAAGLLGLAAVGVALLGTPQAAAVSAVTSLVLLAAAAVVARRDGAAPVAPTAAVAAWLAVVHAGAAGVAFGVVYAGAGWLVAGAAAAFASRRRPDPWFWAASVAGAVLVVVGLVATLTSASITVALTGALVLVVVTGDLQPWLAAALAGLLPPPLGEQPPTAPDRAAVADGVRRAHDVLLGCSVATGLLLVALGPVAAGQGPWGMAVVLLCCAVVALRARRQRVGTGGVVGLLGGLAVLLPVAGAAWSRWPDGRVAVLVAVAGVGVLLLAVAVLPAARTARAGRLAELAEALALVSLPPVLLAASGLLDLVREVVG